ncbi:DNA polymerase III subunit gamma/tau [Mycoplasmopsis primatum]|uniref:DNA polymerase III subunit gamma/tau n=1 Tax=Mycoplasmopsis primatum TaxID=55604 RepID=UPI000496D485|nr:DNA polymerase III subunit gamma/tau [Mycoplasmopsis primatum]
MDYKALYRKYRPRNFDDVKGQDHIIKTLKNIIKTRKISHAYLFNGPRGVGKTSVAKIFASIINCYHNNDDYTKLCDMCASTVNQSIDIIEMDAASNNGVDSIRELREKIQHLPSVGNYKIYIIDEVHMLSKGAFNALLKTLEEPPAHAVFILATTDAQKIPLTILSRVQRFNFRKITNDILAKQIVDVLQAEKIKYEPKAINYIARLATGGMRDALSILDQAIAYGNGNLKLADIMYAFGVVSNDNLIKMVNLLYEGNVKEAILLLDELRNAGCESSQFVEGLLQVIKDYIIYHKSENAKLLEIIDLDEMKLLKIDMPYALAISENIYKLIKDLYYFNSDPFQLIELYLIKSANEKNQKEKPIMNDSKLDNKKHKNVETVLNQTQELFVESNIDTTINDLVQDDILTNSMINTDDNYVDDGIIDTSEIDLKDVDEEDNSLIQVVPKFDKTYENLTEFKSIFTDEQLYDALVLADSSLLRTYTSTFNYITSSLKENKNGSYDDLIKALSRVSIKAAGTNYLVFSSNDIQALNYLQKNCYKQNIQEFLKNHFGSYKHLLLFEKEQYKAIGLKALTDIQTNFEVARSQVKPLGDVIIEKEPSANKQLFDLLKNIK